MTLAEVTQRCAEFPETVPLPTATVLAMVAALRAAVDMRQFETDHFGGGFVRDFDRALASLETDAALGAG